MNGSVVLAAAAIFSASFLSEVNCAIRIKESLLRKRGSWHCLQVLRQSSYSASATRSVTHCIGVRTRNSGGIGLPVKSRLESRVTRISPGPLTLYDMKLLIIQASTIYIHP